MSAIIVKDSCVNCGNLGKIIEFGACDCSSNNISKSLSGAEVSWLRRHGKLSEIQKPLKRYSMQDVEIPLKNIEVAMANLLSEGERLCLVTKGIKETAQRKNRMGKRRYSKLKLEISVSKRLETSKAELEKGKNEMLKKSDNLVTVGVLSGELKGMELVGWIQKRIEGN